MKLKTKLLLLLFVSENSLVKLLLYSLVKLLFVKLKNKYIVFTRLSMFLFGGGGDGDGLQVELYNKFIPIPRN